MEYENICTLGPVGTDSEFLARRLSNNVILKDNFQEVINAIIENEVSTGLIPCGYKSSTTGDSWVDFHFKYYQDLKVLKILHENTKNMILIGNLTGDKDIISLHPATISLLPNSLSNIQRDLVNNKPMAIKNCLNYNYKYAIISEDIFIKHIALEYQIVEIARFNPSMVWTLYGKK